MNEQNVVNRELSFPKIPQGNKTYTAVFPSLSRNPLYGLIRNRRNVLLKIKFGLQNRNSKKGYIFHVRVYWIPFFNENV